MKTEYRKGFYYKGKRLFSYPLQSETDDTQIATMEMLAFQQGCSILDIEVLLEECAPKQRDFARDCMTERMGDHKGKERWRILNVTNGTLYTHVGPLEEFVELYEAGNA
ncbi:MAG: hypothetical protein IKG69_01215 [Atopobiaceae bacterium]|nr:hypothetical protein [Atopobiaceae bacterium]